MKEKSGDTWAAYSPHDTDAEIVLHFCRKHHVSKDRVKLKRTGGAVLVRIKEDNDNKE